MSAPFYPPINMQQEIGQNPPGFGTEPVPISTYQDNEPVPISTYREDESDPLHTTQQEKDDFWENGFNREDNIQDPEPFQAKENGKRSVDNSSFTHGETDLNQLPAIPPVSTGQGLPYAPVDWPSPGDVWTWRVGRRVTAVGYHQDRFLILPQRLQQKNVPKSFASKATLLRYIQSNFPAMDADAFFASFSWKIPALFQAATKVDTASLFEETPKEAQTEAAPVDENAKEGNSRYSQRKRKPMPTQTYEPVEPKPKPTPRGGKGNKKKKGDTTPASATPSSTKPKSSRQSTRRASNQNQQSGGAVDLNYDEGEPASAPNTSGRRKKRRVNFEDEDVSIPHIYVSPMNGVLAVSHSPIDVDPVEFDSYLDSLENLLHQGPEDTGRDSVLVSASSPMREYEWAEARMKISSLLEKDFPSLFVSKDAAEIAALATKLRKDPNLSAEEIVRLKLIEEIPTFSEVFQENKGVIEEADRFFSALELNKAKVASLKYEYSDLRHKLGSLQMEVDENTEAIRQIDDQIAQLQARRSELKRYIAEKEKEKVDASYGQKMVANSIPKVVQEVQSANSKKSEWECKKDNALKREAEILSKFTPLKGFFL
ncbi:unnamed protein product [Thlaspi arvense]|uniref:DUF7081 domain-containing protein n=1 Tax=Thlaspi arvense TaxID=13288 RepID=A0AAU9RYI4_THLAR|nr:unnamed protein product [Thlaspi arvense]